MLLVGAVSKHLQAFSLILRTRSYTQQLVKPQDARASKVSGWVVTLEANVDPLLRLAFSKFLFGFQSRPQCHKFLLMFIILLIVLAWGAESCLCEIEGPDHLKVLNENSELCFSDWDRVLFEDLGNNLEEALRRFTDQGLLIFVGFVSCLIK